MNHAYTYTRSHDEGGWTVIDEERQGTMCDREAAAFDERMVRQGWHVNAWEGGYTYTHPEIPGSVYTLSHMYAPDYYAD